MSVGLDHPVNLPGSSRLCFLPPSPGSGVTDACLHVVSLWGCWGSKLRSSCLHNKHSMCGLTCSTPEVCLNDKLQGNTNKPLSFYPLFNRWLVRLFPVSSQSHRFLDCSIQTVECHIPCLNVVGTFTGSVHARDFRWFHSLSSREHFSCLEDVPFLSSLGELTVQVVVGTGGFGFNEVLLITNK